MERRRFLRVMYQAPATLSQDDLLFNAMVKDISLHGLLVNCETPSALVSDRPIDVNIPLNGGDIAIQLTAQIIEKKSNLLRLKVDHIDLESLGHLKRLVELNMGNDELLHRDLDHLMDMDSNDL